LPRKISLTAIEEMHMEENLKVLILSQTFYPDNTSIAQHETDLAVDLVREGCSVTVLTSCRSYDNPQVLHPSRETFKGIKIKRLYTTGFGKKIKLLRITDAGIFFINIFQNLLFSPKYDIVVGLTLPPLLAIMGVLFCLFRGGKFIYWVMDLNPDEAIQAGMLREDSFLANILEKVSRFCFTRSPHIIALDKYMKKRIEKKGIDPGKISIIPPWAHDNDLSSIPHRENPFRKEHNLDSKFVIMYSGNHSLIHPLDTLLESALKLRDVSQYVFLFIGGGIRVQDVLRFKQIHSLGNIVYLPYQPREKLKYSLSSADLHVVVMGNRFVGTVHPCKIYGIMCVGRPFVFIGPKESHIGDIISQEGIGYQFEHGQTELLIKLINKLSKLEDIEKGIITQVSHPWMGEKWLKLLVKTSR